MLASTFWRTVSIRELLQGWAWNLCSACRLNHGPHYRSLHKCLTSISIAPKSPIYSSPSCSIQPSSNLCTSICISLCDVSWWSVGFHVKSSFKLMLIHTLSQSINWAFSVSFPKQFQELTRKPSLIPGRPFLLIRSTGNSSWNSWRTVSCFRLCFTAKWTLGPPKCLHCRLSRSRSFLWKSC